MKQIIIYVAAALLMSSCGIYKKYERPSGITTDSIFGSEYHSQQETSLADLHWRQLFDDTCLQSLIDSALVRNTDLLTAKLRVEQAMTGLRIARLDYLPSINLVPEGAVGDFDNYENLKTGTSWTYNIAAATSWELEIFGKKTNAKRKAKASVEMAKDYQQAVKTGLIAAVATQYYTLLLLDEQLRITESTSEKFGESVRVMKAMMRAGMGNEVAVAQLEGAWNQVKAAEEDIKRSLHEVENSLNAVLCQHPRRIERSRLGDLAFPAELSTGIPSHLLSRRPDVRAAEHQLAVAYYDVNIAKGNLFPSIKLSGIAGWTNSLGGTVTDPAGLLLNAGASLFQPIFNAGALRGKVRIAKAEQQAALLAFQQAVINAGTEVNNALTKYQTALDKEKWRNKQVASMAKAVEKTEKMMQHSSTTYLDVLTAQQAQLQAETAQAQDTYEKITAVVELYRALGGGAE